MRAGALESDNARLKPWLHPFGQQDVGWHLQLSEPRFPHLHNEHDSTCLPCQAHGRGSTSGRDYYYGMEQGGHSRSSEQLKGT